MLLNAKHKIQNNTNFSIDTITTLAKHVKGVESDQEKIEHGTILRFLQV